MKITAVDGPEQPQTKADVRQMFHALHEKYLEEQRKRIRPDGSAQYVQLTAELARYLDDPYAEPGFTRAPLTDEVDVAVLGGGFSGILTAGYLRRAGVDNVRVIDKASDFGGTWYWNRYPGAACDVVSYIYMPLLEELNYTPTHKYAPGPELLEYSRALGRHFDLYRNACFQTQVTEIRWDDEIARWIIRTDRHDEMKARFVCVGSGPLNRPKLPAIPGIAKFKGHSFHTCRWDYSYTGGNGHGNLSRLADKRIAIIGTGATAVQSVPHLGAAAKELYVFQRTPSIVGFRGQAPLDPEWSRDFQPGWQYRHMENFDAILAGIPQDEDLVKDMWTDFWDRRVNTEGERANLDLETLMQLADYEKMEKIRRRIETVVKDPATAEALKPYYNRFCKRPCFHDEYLETFNRPNVTLVDTQGKGVERITENAVVVGRKSYEVDCIIYATGFELAAPADRAGGFDLRGRNGQTLEQKWANGPKSLHGMYARGFPNLAMVGSLRHSAITANGPYIFGEQAKHFSYMVKYALDHGVKVMDVSEEAEEKWGALIKEKATFSQVYLQECTPGSWNNEGKADEKSLFNNGYGGGPIEYINILEDWRVSGLSKDMELTYG